MVKISKDTINMIEMLPREKKDKVDAIVRRHVAACYKNGFMPENLERVFIEAVEMVDIEERFPEPVIEEVRDWEPVRSYFQYVSPKAA